MKKNLFYLLFPILMFASAFAQTATDTNAAYSLIPEDSIIAIKTSAGKYLMANANDNSINATGTDKTKAECQFRALKLEPYFIGFESKPKNYRRLQMNPGNKRITFDNNNFDTSERWSLEGTTLDSVKIKNPNANNQYLTVSGDNVTADATGSTFSIEIISPAGTGTLEYNKLIRIRSTFAGELWTLPWYRIESVKGRDDDSLEILVRTHDTRASNGCELFMLRSATDRSKSGTINYGDKVEIYSLSTLNASGWGGTYNTTWPLTRKWVANTDSAWEGQHGEILVVGPKNAKFNSNERIFTLTSNSGKTGPISLGDEVRIVANLSNPIVNNDIWLGDSHPKWGSGYKPLHIDDKTAKRTDLIKTRGVFKFKAVPQAVIDDPTSTAYRVSNEMITTDPTVLPDFSLTANAVIAIKDNASGKYLCTNATDMLLKATGTSKDKPECQFKVLKNGKWFGFKSETANDNNLQSNPAGNQIKFNNKNFSSYQFFALSGQLEKAKILSNISKKYIAVSGETVISDATGSEFTIEIISLQPSDFPAPYVCITPKAQLDEIALGCKDGKLEIWAIDDNSKVYRFNELAGAPFTIPGNVIDPWERQELKDEIGKVIPGFDGICATCDGNLFGIRSDDKTIVKYNWTTKLWVQMQITNAIQIKLEEIAAAKGNEIYAVSADDKIYELKNNTWMPISSGSGIAAGIGTDNKSIVIGLSTTGIPYKLESGKWTQLGTEIELEKVAIGSQNYILGINSEKQLVKWDGKKWTLVPGKTQTSIASVDDIAAIPSGTTVAVDRFGNVWHNGDDAVNVTDGKVVIKKTTTTTVTKAVAEKKVSTSAKKKAVKKVSSKKTKKVAKKSKATVKKTKLKKAKKAATTKTAKKTKTTKAATTKTVKTKKTATK